MKNPHSASKTQEMFKVSVVVPGYNHEPFLAKRIDSLLNQTFDDFEIIFLDDNSTDDSLFTATQLLSDLNNKIPFKIIKNSVNSGSPFKQWNKGVTLSQGKYIWIAESDDFANYDFLKKTVEILETDKSLSFVYCQSAPVDDSGIRIAPDYKTYTNIVSKTKW